jgi:hypothetical protein
MLLRSRHRCTKMTLWVEVLLVFRIVSTVEIFEKLISLVLENLSFLSIMRIIHHSHHRFINLKDLRHLSQLLASRYSLNFEAVKVSISHYFLAINVKEANLISSHYSQTAFYLPMVCCNSLQMSSKLLTYICPAPSLPCSYLIE